MNSISTVIVGLQGQEGHWFRRGTRTQTHIETLHKPSRIYRSEGGMAACYRDRARNLFIKNPSQKNCNWNLNTNPLHWVEHHHHPSFASGVKVDSKARWYCNSFHLPCRRRRSLQDNILWLQVLSMPWGPWHAPIPTGDRLWPLHTKFPCHLDMKLVA